MAKQTLVDAHISVARDIAMGNFQRQAEVVPKWLLRATELADEFITEDYGDELIQMYVFRDTLASYAELQQASFDAAIASEEAMKTGKKLIAEASDDLYKMQVERLLAETLLHSARISRARGRYDEAMKIANNALALVDNTKDQWEETTHDRYLRGQLCFLVGSIYAVQQGDHQEAAEWYAKSRELAIDSDLVSPLYTPRNHGEMYVSMGLTHWEIGDQERAIAFTKQGAELMEAAVEKGSLLVAALAVPYGNLATMHGKLGDNSKSQEFAKLVAKVEESVLSQKR
jgi:tetratricopeptide (TPR) repeat protein